MPSNNTGWGDNVMPIGPKTPEKNTHYIHSNIRIFVRSDYQSTEDYQTAVNKIFDQIQKKCTAKSLPVQLTSLAGEIHIMYSEVRKID